VKRVLCSLILLYPGMAAAGTKGVVAWEVGAWAVAFITGVMGVSKAIEWLLQSSGLWKKTDTKILEAQQETLHELSRLNRNVGKFLETWPAAQDHLQKLRDSHAAGLGEKPPHWCALREDAHKAHVQQMEKALGDLKELLGVVVASGSKTVQILRGLSKRLKLEEEDDDE